MLLSQYDRYSRYDAIYDFLLLLLKKDRMMILRQDRPNISVTSYETEARQMPSRSFSILEFFSSLTL
uniref:Uncharacterized protein n=1 Tax=Utricularia reniformis TaxID=192314 RepID=A0A1Y0B3W3_9LAMI|nr:hypothetical protein AEK19_MT0859 [Utricularia reniformis]YP_009382276.1 hypothetical protein AEK19_MT1850 [Utricularia reniformis]ART31092.1 hypothetical protein AEK19_MT0859 [Utricularia reniformis]ART32019.1 hypothetical protein AEK19_MT1850 [Utricularia reniformis]